MVLHVKNAEETSDMHTLLKGAPVRDAIDQDIISRVELLTKAGNTPKIATFRIGEDDGEKYYEGAIIKRAGKYGIDCESVVLDEAVSQSTAEEELERLNNDDNIDGIIMLMPFPKSIDGERLRALLDPAKDIDAITDASYANLFANDPNAFYACTAESCMEILKFYGVDLKGKQVTIVGRSMRVGKPLMLMMMNANATVTVCHTKTTDENLREACERADVVVLATGQIESYSPKLFHDGQIIIDVGTGTGKDGKLAGDFDSGALEAEGMPKSLSYSPVPGGVGTVTTALLLRNVVKAAERA